MREIELFQNLLEKYMFSERTAEDIHSYSIKSGRNNLKKILKKTGNYTIAFTISMAFFYWLRKLGIHATILQSKIVALIVTINITASILLGTTYIVKKIVTRDIEVKRIEEQKIIKQEKIKTIEKIPDKKKTIHSSVIKFDFGIKSFSGNNKSEADIITRQVVSELKTILGNKKVGMISQKRKFSVSKIIMGSVRKIGEKNILTIKIINVVTSRVEYLTTAEITGENDENAIEKITKKLAAKLN